MNYRMNHAEWNVQAWNGQANLVTVASDIRVLYNQTSISLRWSKVERANFYRVQVSLYPDFRSCFVDTYTSQDSYQFTDSQVNDAKRWWRWRPSVTVGGNFLAPYSDVGSYWLNTGAALEIEIPENYWTIFDMNDVTDQYIFDLDPIYTVTPRNLYRFQGRNRIGNLLTEFLAIKDDITLAFESGQYIVHQQMDEIQRFHNTKRTFFLATYSIWKHAEPIGHIWKVECTDDPTFTMIGAGRADLVRGTVTLTEI